MAGTASLGHHARGCDREWLWSVFRRPVHLRAPRPWVSVGDRVHSASIVRADAHRAATAQPRGPSRVAPPRTTSTLHTILATAKLLQCPILSRRPASGSESRRRTRAALRGNPGRNLTAGEVGTRRDHSRRFTRSRLGGDGARLEYAVADASDFARYEAEGVTDEINSALDAGDPAYAFRVLTRAAQVMRQHGEEFGERELSRNSVIKTANGRRSSRPYTGKRFQQKTKPAWATPQKLSRPWFISQFEPLRERAKATTPPELRALNIFVEANSLTRA